MSLKLRSLAKANGAAFRDLMKDQSEFYQVPITGEGLDKLWSDHAKHGTLLFDDLIHIAGPEGCLSLHSMPTDTAFVAQKIFDRHAKPSRDFLYVVPLGGELLEKGGPE